jgi:hypothetical protein
MKRLLVFGSFAHNPQGVLAAIRWLALVGVELVGNTGKSGVVVCQGLRRHVELRITAFADSKCGDTASTFNYPQFSPRHVQSLAHPGWRSYTCGNQTAPVPDLVFRHQAQPFPDGNARPIRSCAFSREAFISQTRENLHRLGMKRIAEGHHFFVAISQLSPATGVAAGLPLNGFRKHVAFDGSNVAHQISEGEFAFTKRPLQSVRRNALRNPRGPLMNLAEIFQEPIDRQRWHGLSPERSVSFSGLLVRPAKIRHFLAARVSDPREQWFCFP